MILQRCDRTAAFTRSAASPSSLTNIRLCRAVSRSACRISSHGIGSIPAFTMISCSREMLTCARALTEPINFGSSDDPHEAALSRPYRLEYFLQVAKSL